MGDDFAEALGGGTEDAKDIILSYFVFEKLIESKDITDDESVETLSGYVLTFVVSENDVITIDGANIIRKDIPAANGVIHVLDNVITPPPPSDDNNDGDESTGTSRKPLVRHICCVLNRCHYSDGDGCNYAGFAYCCTWNSCDYIERFTIKTLGLDFPRYRCYGCDYACGDI